MMPTLAPSNNRRAGFTLIELLVVLAVLSLLAVIFVPNIGRPSAGIVRQQDSAKLADALKRARADAFAKGSAASVDPAKIIPGATYRPALPVSADGSALTFHPDGSSTGGRIEKDGVVLAEIDWLTGIARDGR